MADLNAIASRALDDAKARVRATVARASGTEEVVVGDGNGLVEAIAGSDWVYVRRRGDLFLARNLSGHKWNDGDILPAEWTDTRPGHIMSIIYREKQRRSQVLYVRAATLAIPTVPGSPDGLHLLLVDPHDDPTGASTTVESLGWPATYGHGINLGVSTFVVVNGTVYVSSGYDYGGDVWAYTRATGWVDLGLPTSTPVMPFPSTAANSMQLFKHDGAAHGLALTTDISGNVSYQLYRFEGTTAALIGQRTALPGDVKAILVSAGSPTPDGPGAIFFGTHNVNPDNEPTTPIEFVRRIDAPQTYELNVVTDNNLTAFVQADSFGDQPSPAYQWIVSGDRFHVSKGIGVVIAAPSNTLNWDMAIWVPRFVDLNTPFIIGRPTDTALIDIIELPLQGSSRCYWTINHLYGAIGSGISYANLHFGPKPTMSFGSLKISYFGDIYPDTFDTSQVARVSVAPNVTGQRFFQPYVIGDYVYVGIQLSDPSESGPSLACGVYSPSPMWEVFYPVIPNGILGPPNTNVIAIWKGESV